MSLAQEFIALGFLIVDAMGLMLQALAALASVPRWFAPWNRESEEAISSLSHFLSQQ